MAGMEFDTEKIRRYFNGKYSDKDTSYIDEVFCDDNKEKELKSLLSVRFEEFLPNDDMDRNQQ